MRIQLVHDHYDADHLAAVTAEMRERGAPTIRAVDTGDGTYAALEGSHRLRAAVALGLEPEIDEVEYSDADVESVVPGQFQDALTIEEVVDRSHLNPTAEFDEDGARIIG